MSINILFTNIYQSRPLRSFLNKRIMFITLYLLILVFFISIPYIYVKKPIYIPIQGIINGEFSYADIALLIEYYCIKLGVVLFSFSIISDEIKDVGRYIFVRSEKRSSWLIGKFIRLGMYAFIYWIILYMMYIISIYFGASVDQIDIESVIMSFIINWLNSSLLLFAANAIAQFIDERLSLLFSISFFILSDFIQFTSKGNVPWGLILPSTWGRYSVITQYSNNTISVYLFILGIMFLNIATIIAIIYINCRLLKKYDIY